MSWFSGGRIVTKIFKKTGTMVLMLSASLIRIRLSKNLELNEAPCMPQVNAASASPNDEVETSCLNMSVMQQ